MFDCQVKRIHEYKRQLLNALRIVILYDRLRNGDAAALAAPPRTFLFAGKAAPAYHVAKLIGETTPNAQALEYARYLDEHFIQKGRLGVASGQGFYSYPNPAFAQPGFIRSSQGGGR